MSYKLLTDVSDIMLPKRERAELLAQYPASCFFKKFFLIRPNMIYLDVNFKRFDNLDAANS